MKKAEARSARDDGRISFRKGWEPNAPAFGLSKQEIRAEVRDRNRLARPPSRSSRREFLNGKQIPSGTDSDLLRPFSPAYEGHVRAAGGMEDQPIFAKVC